VGNLKGVGRIYQQTFIDSYCKVALVKLYDRKHAITAADMLNERVLLRAARCAAIAHPDRPGQRVLR
jgi:hypothetical protein